MTYRLEFLPSALKEWEKLGHTVREQARKKLRQRLLSPKVGVDALRDLPNHYKIKLRASGYRLVYRVEDDRVVVVVVAIGKRERGQAYRSAYIR
ncbi:RelE toxin [Pseudomonas sp. 250J]|uniref:Type II toxin-antitoxin system RelE/ParE family toxin n=1 Tax=Pseudomonas peradeniyensis TaxID=2745488 RepID=A0ABT2V536_9PSED|nr:MULTISPECIES: type II toxin-antitoxin system RelE/ParE family toxin [Pseudomonas]KNX78335.1 RelE toxin [Pseudomonas sp. 250J]MCU7236768.1 type II toxin-antitoxin system RelE/ParE family toxin [Pseudomonas peradeniyensis]MCU7281790.1 type II toxin-antitoxin system RelE/ParE family toxin [Pseudomonas peradeniyensis]QZA52475.1 type II toxin-antitoxin system RelE/ParE family toxin [Pseudomonas sp. 2hn]